MVDGLEQQLNREISACSSCPLGAGQSFLSPLLAKNVDTVLLLEAPALRSCEENNPWEATGVPFLGRALQHAAGGDLSRFHVTFVSKCIPRLGGFAPPRRQRRDWASVCASQHLYRELKAISPRRILMFGEMVVRVCFPNVGSKWCDLNGQSMLLEPLLIESHLFDSPSRLQKIGLAGSEGEFFLSRLNKICGGLLSPPDASVELDLFELI